METAPHPLPASLTAFLCLCSWKHVKFMSPPGAIIGCDFAGTVVQAESGLPVQIGDKVAGMVHGGMGTEYGSFAQYIKTDGNLVVKVPEQVEVTRASSVGIAGYTAAQASCSEPEMTDRLAEPFPTGSFSTTWAQSAFQDCHL